MWASVVGLMVLFGAPERAAHVARPNIVFLLADDLGYGDLGCYGQERIRTPHIDRLAREGMRFTDYYAGSTVCAPSRCVLMTGLHTGHCRIRGNARFPLLPHDPTVAELLQSASYRTALIGKWGLGDVGSTGHPLRKGFDHFFGYLDQLHAHNYYPSFLWEQQRKVRLRNVVRNEGPAGEGVADEKLDYSHDLFIERAVEFVEKHKEGPFFLYLALTIPHANNEAGPKGMEVPDLGEYASKDWPEPLKATAAMIARMDRDVGRLLDRIDELGIGGRTIVFFSSDNGPHQESGREPDFFASSGPFRGYKRDLYEGGIRVPFLVRQPGVVPAGSRTDFAGYFADFFPTAAELAGVAPPAGLDGVSIVPTLTNKPAMQKQHEYLYWEFHERGSAAAARMGRWKAVRKPITGPIELYDLAADPGETQDVSKAHPELVSKLEAIFRDARTESEHWPIGRPAKASRREARKRD